MTPQEPEAPEEWQECVDAAAFYLAIDSCRQYGLIETEMCINQERCGEILERGKKLGYKPAPMTELCKMFFEKAA